MPQWEKTIYHASSVNKAISLMTMKITTKTGKNQKNQ